MASNNSLLGVLGQYDPRNDQYYYEKQRLMEQMAAMQNAAGGLGQARPMDADKACKTQAKQDPQPNPVLLLTGDDE